MRFFKKRTQRALLLWYTVGENFGDYYIFQTVSSYLRTWGYDVQGIDVGLPWADIAKKAKNYDLLWFAGGGIIERGIPDVIRNFKKFHKRAKRIKYGVTGLSIGEFDYSMFSDSIAYWVYNAQFFYTRDDYSAKKLNRLADSDKVIPSADVVFACKFDKTCLKSSGFVGVNLRNLPYIDLSGELDWEKWNQAISENVNAIGIPDQYDFSDKVSFDVDKCYSPEKALAVILKSDFVIAMRFHVILVAARFGKVSIPICYCPKVERLVEQLGLSDLKLDVYDYELLPQMVCKVVQERDKYEKIIETNVNKLEKCVNEMFDNIKEILDGGN